jgi:hypothetical protein
MCTFSCIPASEGDSPSDANGLHKIPAFDSLLDPLRSATDIPNVAPEEKKAMNNSPLSFYGTWRVVEFLPNTFSIMGVLQPYLYLSMASEALNKEIECQSDFYRFDDFMYTNIEYKVKKIISADYEEAELLHLFDRINQFSDSYEISTLYLRGYVEYVYISGVEDDYLRADEPSDEGLLSLTTIEFVIIDENYLYCIASGLLCERI